MRHIRLVSWCMVGLLCGVIMVGSGVRGVAFAQEEKKESTASMPAPTNQAMQKSFTKAIRENIVLKKEKEETKTQLDEASARNRIFQDRLNDLNNIIARLTKELDTMQSDATSKQEELSQQLNAVKDQNKILEDTIVDLIKERESNVYFELWAEAEQDLQYAEDKVQKIATEKEALKIRSGKLHYNLGNFYTNEGQYKEAVSEYEAALQFLPEDPDIYYNLGVLYDHHLGDREKANKYYVQYITRNPEASDVALVRERLIANGLTTKVYNKHSEAQEQ